MATKNNSGIFGWAICIVAGVLLYKHFTPTDVTSGNSAAGIQSDEAAAAMDAQQTKIDVVHDNRVILPGGMWGPGRPWFGGPPIVVDDNGDPIKVPPSTEEPPLWVIDYPPPGKYPFMEDITPQPYPWKPPVS